MSLSSFLIRPAARNALSAGFATIASVLVWVPTVRGWEGMQYMFTDDIGRFDPISVPIFSLELILVGVLGGLLGVVSLGGVRRVEERVGAGASRTAVRYALAIGLGLLLGGALGLLSVSAPPRFFADCGLALAATLLAVAISDRFERWARETSCAS